MKPKVKVYIDGANMFYTQKKLGWFIDWKKVKGFLAENREILEIREYFELVKSGKSGIMGGIMGSGAIYLWREA